MVQHVKQDIELSIIIKTLNEAANIERTISAVRVAANQLRYEIVVADSLSTDDTLRLAKASGAKTVQLLSVNDRSCGVGAQLGYQFTRGEFIYLLDGDMECIPGFMDAAIAYLRANHDVAGVAGDMAELGGGSYEFELRRQLFDKFAQGEWHGDKPWLDGGGVFRRAALEQLKYITDRNLHAYEEKDLGFRLTTAGWRMIRLPLLAVKHKGHAESTWHLLKKRWQTKYVNGGGNLLRACLYTPNFWQAVVLLKQYVVLSFLMMLTIFSLLLLPVATVPLWCCLCLWFAVAAIMCLRKGGVRAGLLALAYLLFWSAGLVRGFLSPRTDPASPIPCSCSGA